ncbi:MAG: methyltransferase domain-containing protein [Actinophytocola sp.]|uniref:methyltransferase domain-containing protein n=1 Tax=Actinophytocola sp. TaxID=1872138 RepID=UPI001321E9C3|nr:methyltransferase domain-containing protein [Actinophytocola sp.]MPZ83137.1 methyltransferase domain-containing protein [Actinophytocola sp.]
MTDAEPLPALRAKFLDELAASGDVTDPEWLAAFRDVPRDAFVPHFLKQTPDLAGWRLVQRGDPEWFAGVHSMAPLITQLDGDDALTDKARAGESINGTATSSSSQPTLMGLMLQALDVRDGHRVLEIGTGTGYNTALLCHRLGAANVTSVDVDAVLIERAAHRLAGLGYADAHVFAGDGREGCAERGPYDRIIVTVGVAPVPGAWLDQTRDGGRMLVPLDRRNCGGLLALLTVHGDTASGPFLPDYGGFMPIRGTRHDAALDAFRSVQDYQGTHGTTDLAAEVATGSSPFEFFAALRVGGYDHMSFTPNGGGPTETWLANGHNSWVCHTTTDGTHSVRQGGPVRLWDVIEDARGEWERLGEPVRERFGLSVDRDGTHTVWLDEPTSPYRWALA